MAGEIADWTEWQKSRYSGTSNCVEVRRSDTHVQVRDSKHPDGSWLTFSHAEWDAFLAGVSGGEFGCG